MHPIPIQVLETSRPVTSMNENENRPDVQICALIVDDDDDMRALIANVLLDHGHLTVTARSAEDALTLLPHYTFQVAYLDHNLPGMEGMVLGEWLRRNNPFMEVAIVTGSADQRLETWCKTHELVLVGKPFDVAELLVLPSLYVERALARHTREIETHAGHDPPLADFMDELPTLFGLPAVPGRIEERLERRIATALATIRSVSRYTERERVVALTGLITARVLGIRLSRTRDGRTRYEEYDDIMREIGHRVEFTDDDHEA